MLEKQIFDLCSIIVKTLNQLMKKGIITQEEFELNTKLKLQYTKDYNSSVTPEGRSLQA